MLLKSCFVSAFRPIRPDEKQHYDPRIRLLGGIYDISGQPHTDSLLKRGPSPIQAHDSTYEINPNAAKRITSRAIYGGIIFNHYGHFLLESLARAWYLLDSEGDVYFHQKGKNKNGTYAGLKSWQQIILSHLITDTTRIKIINEPLRFDQLTIPDAGYVIKQYCVPAQAKALSQVGENITANCSKDSVASKIWLSRSLLPKGAIAGEKKFETALSNEGFLIVHPQLLSLAEQIQLFEDAAIVAGFTGSAFHTLLMAKNKGALLLHFSRQQQLTPDFKICPKAVGFNAEFYNFFQRYGDKIVGTQANMLQDLNGIWELLYNKGLVSSAKYHDLTVEDDLKRLDDMMHKVKGQTLKRGGYRKNVF